jgi:hypothetical protein
VKGSIKKDTKSEGMQMQSLGKEEVSVYLGMKEFSV